MAFRCAVVIRGGRSPLVVEDTSSIAEACGEAVPIPILLPLAKELTCNCPEELYVIVLPSTGTFSAYGTVVNCCLGYVVPAVMSCTCTQVPVVESGKTV